MSKNMCISQIKSLIDLYTFFEDADMVAELKEQLAEALQDCDNNQ